MFITDKELVDKIKELSTKNGITMKFLCDCLGKRRGFLSEVRCGKDKIDDAELDIIAKQLHTTPEYLRGETDDPSPIKTDGDWVDEIKISPAKLALAKQIAEMSETHAEVLSGLSKFNEEEIRAVARALVMFKNRGEE